MSAISAPVINQLNLKSRSQLALTLGDPAGIGPEVVLKALADPAAHQHCDITVVGSAQVLQQQYEHLLATGATLADPATLKILDVPLSEAAGRISATLALIYPPGIGVIVPGERWDDRARAMRD